MPVDLKGETNSSYGSVEATTLDNTNTDRHIFTVRIRCAIVTVMSAWKSSPLHFYSAMSFVNAV